MSIHKLSATALVTALAMGGIGTAVSQGAARSFSNCTALHRYYPHGVGRVGAHDHTSGRPVATFKRSNALYRANRRLDRDGDGIACEKR